jgi:hypothetical protein
MSGAATSVEPQQYGSARNPWRRRGAIAMAAVGVAVAAGLVAVGVRGPAAQDATPHDLAVAEVLTTPMVDPDGIVFSVALRNDGPEAVAVDEVTVVADEGVDVDVLGASTCRNGCAGGLPWSEAAPMMRRSIEWSKGFRVPAERDVSEGRADVVKIVLRVRPSDADAARRVESECLFVRQILVRVGDRPPQPLGNRHADFVVALDRPDAGMPGVTSGCPMEDWAPVPTG